MSRLLPQCSPAAGTTNLQPVQSHAAQPPRASKARGSVSDQVAVEEVAVVTSRNTGGMAAIRRRQSAAERVAAKAATRRRQLARHGVRSPAGSRGVGASPCENSLWRVTDMRDDITTWVESCGHERGKHNTGGDRDEKMKCERFAARQWSRSIRSNHAKENLDPSSPRHRRRRARGRCVEMSNCCDLHARLPWAVCILASTAGHL